MKNLLILFCSLLLSGVFGETDDGNVSVKEGDSVTLQINPEEIKGATELVWRLNNTVIAKIDLERKDKPPVYTDERFRDRLKLERQTGSLTITNITAEHSGEYQLEIRSRGGIKQKTFRVSVSVSVKEGDSVTLQTGVTDGKNVKWKFNGANLTDSRFTNSEVNHQTGDLNISNIRFDQTGEYEVRINGRLHRIFRISISGEVKSVSVMEGDPVTLHTNVTRIKTEDVIQWFKDSLIAYSNTTTTTKGRFVMNSDGSLFILKIRSEDSGVYDVNITGSRHIHKRFNVIVTESRSNGEKTGPGLLLVLILMGIFLMS